eukprot:TRINITY_DN11672_c0_g1_i1.p1 TRINITY_DN11672_c0_g1~~TRINITY_DN11672_c0_g1_i1.p1  ORF type:complete len:133 (-),score=53.95 TRINITY_DN11672_c0_g1_i1:201-599(-)
MTSNSGQMFVKVLFPPTFSMASKTFMFKGNDEVGKVIQNVKEKIKTQLVNTPKSADWGFYLSEKKIWLDNTTPISQYDSLIKLSQTQALEFRDRSTHEESSVGEVVPYIALASASIIAGLAAFYYIKYVKNS